MKRKLTFLLVLLLLLVNVAFAEDTLTEHDTLIGAELCNYKLLTITVENAEIKKSTWTGNLELILTIILNNENNFGYEGNCHFAAINGWEVHPICSFSVMDDLKKREEIVLELNDTDVTELDDIESLRISFLLNYSGIYVVTHDVKLNLK